MKTNIKKKVRERETLNICKISITFVFLGIWARNEKEWNERGREQEKLFELKE